MKNVTFIRCFSHKLLILYATAFANMHHMTGMCLNFLLLTICFKYKKPFFIQLRHQTGTRNLHENAFFHVQYPQYAAITVNAHNSEHISRMSMAVFKLGGYKYFLQHSSHYCFKTLLCMIIMFVSNDGSFCFA